MKVGDEVICVNPTTGLTKDKKYYILNMQTMSCGCLIIDVGIKYISDYLVGYTCYKHPDKFIVEMNDIRWYNACRFAPIQYKSDEFLSSDQIEKSSEEKIDIEIPEPIQQ